ncbi:ArsR/SmtB family transcription factor [Gaopeijia maritima]|uniref:Metalloregulator ArsR/SmtB family transcription factor n=1 Tax=Gaopeijia maritima TaxID=3119007 RepID=A0ABU9E623_9BACT
MSPTTTTAETLLLRFQAVAEETRMEIVRRLSSGERCVCELQDDLEAGQSRLSFHLRKLREAGLVTDRREGRWVYYTLVPEALDEMRAFLGECAPAPGWSGEPNGTGQGSCCG